LKKLKKLSEFEPGTILKIKKISRETTNFLRDSNSRFSNLPSTFQSEPCNCIDEIQKVLKPLLKKFEFISNFETLWTKVLEKLIKLLKISLKILKKLIKYTDVLQKKI
jgi:hypothetical protein